MIHSSLFFQISHISGIKTTGSSKIFLLSIWGLGEVLNPCWHHNILFKKKIDIRHLLRHLADSPIFSVKKSTIDSEVLVSGDSIIYCPTSTIFGHEIDLKHI